jgi:hypothetical protein
MRCNVIETQRRIEEMDSKPCLTCKKKTRHWQRKTWRNGLEYCKGCWKELEATWNAANSCMACNKVKGKWEEKHFPPERIQKRDKWVKYGRVKKRFVCKKCFEVMTRRKFGVVIRENKHTQTPLLKKMSVLLGVRGG